MLFERGKEKKELEKELKMYFKKCTLPVAKTFQSEVRVRACSAYAGAVPVHVLHG